MPVKAPDEPFEGFPGGRHPNRNAYPFHPASPLGPSPQRQVLPLQTPLIADDIAVMAIYRSMPGVRRSAQTRGRLLQAAKALFVSKGLPPVTVDDICLAASVSKGGFYHHFPDKEHVFLEVALEELRRELERAASPASDGSAPRGAVALLVDLWAWSPRRAQARRRVQAIHRRARRRMSRLPRRATSEKPSEGDSEAWAALALFVGVGQVVQRAMVRRPVTGEQARRVAAG